MGMEGTALRWHWPRYCFMANTPSHCAAAPVHLPRREVAVPRVLVVPSPNSLRLRAGASPMCVLTDHRLPPGGRCEPDLVPGLYPLPTPTHHSSSRVREPGWGRTP